MKTVLVVDDEPYLLDVLCEVLSSNNIQPYRAGCGAQALEKLQSAERIDLVLSEFELSEEMDGVDLLWTIRESFPEISVILMTGNIVSRAGKDAFDGYLRKPFTMDELLKAIEDVGKPKGAHMHPCAAPSPALLCVNPSKRAGG